MQPLECRTSEPAPSRPAAASSGHGRNPADASVAAPGGLSALLRAPWNAWKDRDLQTHLRARLPDRIVVQADPVEGSRRQADAVVTGTFEFIGETHRWPAAPDWLRNPSRDIEWHILLHKFYYAVGMGEAWRDTAAPRYLDTWTSLVDSWIVQTPPGFIAADVTGRRLQNWIQAYSFFAGALPVAHHRRFLCSVHEQVEWLRENLHPARNHRTLELYAVLLAGVAFAEFENAACWREFALEQLIDNMRRDLLPDGVHCELSTDYHHLVLRNYLNARRLCELNSIAVPQEMDELLQRALEFSLHAHRPDGRVPSLSDGDVNDYRALLDQGARLFGRSDMTYVATGGTRGTPPAERCRWFAEGGYAFLRSGWGDAAEPFTDERYLAFDCGPLGAGNHGHLDLLSFEAYAYGKPLVVDPGRFTYHEDRDENWRVRFRGTGYHNTVRVDGRDQTRYRQGPSRYKISGPAPDHHLECFQVGDQLDYLCGTARSHEYDAVHERRIAFVRRQYWLIVDSLRAATPHRYEQLFHLAAPAWQRTVLHARDGLIRCLSPHLLIVHLPAADLTYALDDGHVSERYGEKSPAPIVRFEREGICARFVTLLCPFRLEAPTVRIDAGESLRISLCEGGVRTTDELTLTAHGASLSTARERISHD